MAKFVPLVLILWLFLLVQTVMGQTPEADISAKCRALMAADAPNPTGADAPSIRIANLTAGEVVFGDQLAVTVETRNFDFSPTGNHWHLWVDGRLQLMVYGPTAIIDLPAGRHEVCAIMGDAEHADLGSPDGVIITVMEAGAGTPTTTPPVARTVAETYSQTEDQSSPVTLLVMMGLAALAAFLGWVVGSRLGRQRGGYHK